MSEPIEVEAKPIDQELSTMSKAQKWLAETAERVTDLCEKYTLPDVIENEDQRSAAVAMRTEVRKDIATIDAERKAMLRGVEDELKKFKANVKDVLSPLQEDDDMLKEMLDDYEENIFRLARRIELAQEYQDLAPALVEMVPFDLILKRFGNESRRVWLNRSTPIMTAKAMLADAIETIADAEKTIRESVPEQDVQDTIISYFGSLDLQRALSNARALREQRERLAQLEAERETRWSIQEPMPEPMPEPQPVAEAPAPQMEQPKPWLISIPSATRSEVEHLAAYMRIKGPVFDRIYCGTVESVYAKEHEQY